MFPGNKKWNHQIQENKNLRKKKWFKTNVPQSVELDCRWTVAPFFGGYHSAYAFPQKASLGLTHIQEP